MATGSSRKYDREAIARALDVHCKRGLIAGWQHLALYPSFRVRVELVDAPKPEIELLSAREAFIFVTALGSAAQAYSRIGLPAPSGVPSA